MTFDTFNDALHQYSNPQWGIPVAYDGDFDFTVLRVSEDGRTITLRGGHTQGEMQLTRVDENPNSYFTKITESQQALKGKGTCSSSARRQGGRCIDLRLCAPALGTL